MTRAIKFEVFSSHADLLGEGPIWSAAAHALFWLDIGRKRLFCRSPSDAHARVWTLPDYPGCLAELDHQTIAIAMGEGVHRVDLRSGATDVLCKSPSRPAGTRFNDGKVDPLGRFWAGSMQNNFADDGSPLAVARAIGALYRFDTDGTAQTIVENMGIPNTLAWSPDRKNFYLADSLHGKLFAFDFDAESGDLCNKRVLFDSSEYGVPDGSAIDVDGCLWNARWDAGAVLRITPTGKIDRIIELPALRPTSCAFGGANLDTLYVTSARVGLATEQLDRFPQSGAVFAIEGIAQGIAVPPFLRVSSQTTGEEAVDEVNK